MISWIIGVMIFGLTAFVLARGVIKMVKEKGTSSCSGCCSSGENGVNHTNSFSGCSGCLYMRDVKEMKLHREHSCNERNWTLKK